MYQGNSSDFLQNFISKMGKKNLDSSLIDTFAYYYQMLVSGESGLIYDKDITPVKPDEIKEIDSLKDYYDAGRRVLDNCVMLVLNGGLGTSMGLTKAKSLLRVKNEKTFLYILLKQAELSNVSLSFMNSFSTHQATVSAVSEYKPAKKPFLFLQHRFPKILKHNLKPAAWPAKPALEWNPPGHGDIYLALSASGMLDELLEQGIKYAFISNSDNLGATIDESLLGYFSEKNFSFMMEVAEKTPADIKGGHLARNNSGQIILREAAQCPDNEIKAFQDIKRYGFFNTNNIWINLVYLKDLIEKEGIIRLPIIINPKRLDPRDANSPEVFQIETAMGAAISLFEGATAVKVPRSRFFPVKKCNDLLAVRSDCFIFNKQGRLIRNPVCSFESTKIKLDPKYYSMIDLFNERFAHGAPSLKDCESLIIKGNVFFEKNVIIKGKVIIENNDDKPYIIKEGTVIEKSLLVK